VIVAAVLGLLLLGALAALLSATIARRTAAARVAAVTRALDTSGGPAGAGVAAGERPSLDDALDELERASVAERARRARAAKAENRLAWALGAIANGVVIFDDRGEIVYRNDPAASFLAARHSDALVEEAITTMATDALQGRSAERELELFGPPRRMLNVRAVPLESATRPSGVLVVVEDTSERRRLENVRRDFVANISHELKTPVGALALLAETLLDEDDPVVTKRLDNAVKYSEPGSEIDVRARTDGTWVDVTVRDHGIGIPRRDLERIFERFYRVDRARSRETGGTGLGLAIVRHVASNHRGEVRVESREGVGSTFTLRLPAGPGPVAVTKEAG
jgi:signal transduction histidine kinase